MRSRILSSRFRERVVVTTKGGDSYDGVLYSADRTAIVLRSTRAVAQGENQTDLPLDGEVILFVADIDFMQRP